MSATFLNYESRDGLVRQNIRRNCGLGYVADNRDSDFAVFYSRLFDRVKLVGDGLKKGNQALSWA